MSAETLRGKIRGTQKGMAKLSSLPKCKRCGTSIDEGMDFCEVCGPIMEAKLAPAPSLVIQDQPRPKYTRPETEEGDR